MLIVKKHKVVLLRVRDPERITSVIPTAKVVKLNGAVLVAVPHRIDEMRVLHNLGIRVPSPIKYYYRWSGNKTPFHAQLETAGFLAKHDRAYCLNSLGTGKTLSALWAYDYLRSVRRVNKVLVVAPLSTLERTWADEVFMNFPHLNAVVLHGSAERRKKLFDQDADIYIVNHHGVKIVAPWMAERDDIDLVIYDELAVARNAQTDLWAAANEVCNKQQQRKVWGLTGTPIPNAPTDAWAQCRLVTPGAVPKFFGRFKDQVMRQVTPFKWVARETALDVVHQVMQPSVRFSMDDCMDLPEQIFIERHADLTKDQEKAYKAMMNTLKAEYQGGQILAVNEAVKASKLVQIAVGVAYGDDGSEVVIPATERLKALDELIEESEGKVLVFVPFTGALNYVAEHIGKYAEVAVVNGKTSKHDRDVIFTEFQKGSLLRVIVAQPATMSHGLTLTAATTIVWFAPVNSNETFEQANGRVRRPGQKKKTVIACLAGTPVERGIYQRLKSKQSVQGVLLDLVREQGNGAS